jgi:ubiquinone/menaquinone biosynthesis C-methylase UbiE
MSMTEASKNYFQQVAGQWDNLRSGYFQEEVRRSAIAKSYLRPEMVVADIGSGTGFVAAGLAPLVKEVYVVDGSAEMLEVARKNLSDHTNVQYLYSDGQAINLPDESVDAVFANMYLHHCPDPLAAIHEMVRILKPGGRLTITDMDSHEYAWLKDEMADVWQGFDRDQMRVWYKEADLVNVLVDCTGESCCAKSEDEEQVAEDQRSANISVFLATGSKRLPMREAVQNQYGEIAVSGKSCCSSGNEHKLVLNQPSCCGKPELESGFVVDYSSQDKTLVPEEAEQISLGCGNPSAIANMQPGETVLDIGSGGGMDAFLAAKQVGDSGKVIGVDMTSAMLKRAGETALKNGISNVEFREGTAEALPVEDGTVDVIISNCVINLSEDKAQVFAEAARVLKLGGRLEVSDVVSNKAFPLEARLNNEDWSACISGALPETEYTDLIRQAGFNEIKIKRSQVATAADDVRAYSVHVSAIKTENTVSCTTSCTN